MVNHYYSTLPNGQNTQTKEENQKLSTQTDSKLNSIILTNKLLGKGTHSEVYLGYDNTTHQKLAIKSVNLKKLSQNSTLKLQQEIDILSKLKTWSNSERFVKIQKVQKSENQERLYMAMEYIPGTDLFVLCNEFCLGVPETLAKQIFYSVALSIHELHSYQICHLDLKLENIMYIKDLKTVKIIDFGFSQFTIANHNSIFDSKNQQSENLAQILQTTYCGSIHYAAPELLSRIPFDGKKADIWSLGVVLFALFTGQFPFDDIHANSARIFHNIRFKEVEFPHHLNSVQTNLLSMMLAKDPANRCSIDDVVNHPYFSSLKVSNQNVENV